MEGNALSGALQPQGAALLGQAGKARGRKCSGWPKAPTAGIRTRDLRMSGNATLVTTRLPCPLDHSATVPPRIVSSALQPIDLARQC